MVLDECRLVIDFGLVAFIWAVQLLVYSNFQYIDSTKFVEWHQRYKRKVAYIVAPLMMSQLVLAALQLWENQNWYTVLSN